MLEGHAIDKGREYKGYKHHLELRNSNFPKNEISCFDNKFYCDAVIYAPVRNNYD